MKIQQAEYFENQGRALLRVTIDGIETIIDTEQKPTLHRAGYVFAGAAMEDVLPLVEIEGARLPGMTNDPIIFNLVDRMMRAAADGTFTPGPVDVESAN